LTWLKERIEIPADTVKLWNNIIGCDRHGGRLNLAGDAIHAMPTFEHKCIPINLFTKPTAANHGQGISNSILVAENHAVVVKKIQNGEKAQKLVDAYDFEMLERGMRKTKILMLAGIINHIIELFGDRSLAKIGVK
jgi:hypothetical protein